MDEKVRVLQVGCGKMSKYIMRFVYEKKGIVVGAVDINPDLIGKDIGSVMDSDLKGVKISRVEYLNDLIRDTNPNIAVVTTMSTLNDIEDVCRICLKNGVNVITTCEEAFYGSNSNPFVFKELDTLAKANNCTITGCGYQDVFWGSLVTNLCASTHKVTKIKGLSSYNVEDYGIALAKAHGAGLSEEEFYKTIGKDNNMSDEQRNERMANNEFFPSYMWNVVGWLNDKLGLHITNIKQECLPILTDEELHSDTLNLTLDPKMVRGMNAVVTAISEEGIVFEVECIGKVYTKDEYDINEWTVFGEPTTKMVNEKPDTVLLTCADIVNRIPDVINAQSGFISTSKMGEPHYIVKNF